MTINSAPSLIPAPSGLGRTTTAKPLARQLTPIKLARQRIAQELRTDESEDRQTADERKNANKAKDTYYKTRHWAQQHKLCLPQAPLPQPVLDVIEEWFFLVDDDGSGSLDAEELEAAFTACDVPCDKASIQAMVTAITHDGRHGAEIFWEDFKAFMTGEFTAGKNMLKGEYVLPGGQALPFGLIIKRLKRHMLLEAIMAGGEERDTVTRQHNLARLDLQAEAAMDAEASLLGSKRERVKDKRRRRMSLGAVVAMEQHKYTEDGVDTFDCAMEQFMEQTNLDDVLAKDRRRTLLMSTRSRTITASRRASTGLVRGNSLNSAASRAASTTSLSTRGGRDGTDTHAAAATAAAALHAPFPEFEGSADIQMPPLAVSPSGETFVHACSPKQVLADLATAAGRSPLPQAEADRPWRHLLTPCSGGPAAPAAAAAEARAGPGGRAPEAKGGRGDQAQVPAQVPASRGRGADVVRVAQRRDLTPPRRSASPRPVAQALADVADARHGYAAHARYQDASKDATGAHVKFAADLPGAPYRKKPVLPPLDIPGGPWLDDPSPGRPEPSPAANSLTGHHPHAGARPMHTLLPLPGAPSAAPAEAVSSAMLQRLLSSPTMKPAGAAMESPRFNAPGSRGGRGAVMFEDAESEDDEVFPCTAALPPAGRPPPVSWAAADAAGNTWNAALRARLKTIDPSPIEENLPKATARQMRMHELEGVAQAAFVASVTGAALGGPGGRRGTGAEGQRRPSEAVVENPWDAIPLDLSIPLAPTVC